MPDMRRTCPGCESAMTGCRARDVAFDRCAFCGGVWIDAGALASLAAERTGEAGSESPRCCPDCGYLLRYASAGDVLVERCPECAGVYVGADMISNLAAELHPEQTDAHPPHEDGAETFTCPGCGETYDVSIGVHTSRGMSCGPCYGAVSHGPSPAPAVRCAGLPEPAYGLPDGPGLALRAARAVPGNAGAAVDAVLLLLDLLTRDDDS